MASVSWADFCVDFAPFWDVDLPEVLLRPEDDFALLELFVVLFRVDDFFDPSAPVSAVVAVPEGADSA
ncbi:hypothetical protein GCM10027174_23110 [Salinifilum aidingensis]